MLAILQPLLEMSKVSDHANSIHSAYPGPMSEPTVARTSSSNHDDQPSRDSHPGRLLIVTTRSHESTAFSHARRCTYVTKTAPPAIGATGTREVQWVHVPHVHRIVRLSCGVAALSRPRCRTGRLEAGSWQHDGSRRTCELENKCTVVQTHDRSLIRCPQDTSRTISGCDPTPWL